MKGGSVPLLGVLSYASPIISTGLLVVLGLAAGDLVARRCLRADGAGGGHRHARLTGRLGRPRLGRRDDPTPAAIWKHGLRFA